MTAFWLWLICPLAEFLGCLVVLFIIAALVVACEGLGKLWRKK